MTLVVETPPHRAAEWRHILGVVLGDRLGQSWKHVPGTVREVRIKLAGAEGTLKLPATLLAIGEEDWLAPPSLPGTAPVWDARELTGAAPQIATCVPLIYGDCSPSLSQAEGELRLPIDVFGSAFFMLSRYEEVALQTRDLHQRFPASASHAFANDYLDRPIVDEYIELLWQAMSRLWPGLKRRTTEFRMLVSHDVDAPARYGPYLPVPRLMRACAGDIIRRRDPKAMARGLAIGLRARTDLHPADPFNTFEWLMAVSEQHGLKSAFYFMSGRTDPTRDAAYEPEHPAIRRLMRRIYTRGHEIGLHPSYGSYLTPSIIAREARRLRQVAQEEGIVQTAWGGRMHFLRWAHPTTLYGWEQAEMSYDSTLGYADRAGFRCGTCHEYPAFDPVAGKALKLRIRPLVAMECTVIAARYMNLGHGAEAFAVFERLKAACRAVGGNFTLLWHNSHLTTEEDRELYKSVLAA